mmetsp:Transcript_32424/g.28710  ORF Transcript_32424/g.28710 Transcript_32424/m.28710 type:complete len:124 (-) Transcript_32424:113-484(-)
MPKAVPQKKGAKSQKKISHKFVLNCKLPIEDNIIVLGDFENFMKTHIKVANKKGNLGSQVTVAKDGHNLVVSANIAFSKRYLKYLTKKYLKKQELKEYLRVVASNKNTYELRYFNINNDEAEA